MVASTLLTAIVRHALRAFRWALLALMATTSAASATAPKAKATVIFFAGYASTETDTQRWRDAAQATPPYGQAFDFEAVPYPPNTTYVERDALVAGRRTIDATARKIASAPNRSFIIAGHSSGAALAAAVAERSRGRTNVKLIVLDDGVDEGFAPPRGFEPATQIECWSVANGKLVSYNRDAARAFCGNYHEFAAKGCRTDVCLHFAIVNLNAAADLTYETAFAVGRDGGTGGYQNLKVNLSWLDSSIGF
jgi:pimeloyl-ACP methyl ester carboxylesterase